MNAENLRAEYIKDKKDVPKLPKTLTNKKEFFTEEYVEWLEQKLVKKLTIPDVSKRSELLIAYDKWKGLEMNGTDKVYIDTFLDQYNSNL